jgi:hypothetical protein
MHNANKIEYPFSVWHDMQEQWDPENIDEPAMQCYAVSFLAAAERCADDSDASYANLIVRNDTTDEYRNIELQRSWNIKTDRPTSLKELCAP